MCRPGTEVEFITVSMTIRTRKLIWKIGRKH